MLLTKRHGLCTPLSHLNPVVNSIFPFVTIMSRASNFYPNVYNRLNLYLWYCELVKFCKLIFLQNKIHFLQIHFYTVERVYHKKWYQDIQRVFIISNVFISKMIIVRIHAVIAVMLNAAFICIICLLLYMYKLKLRKFPHTHTTYNYLHVTILLCLIIKYFCPRF